MSLWQRLCNHPKFTSVQSRYNEQFPVEVRFACAEWIENQIVIDKTVDLNIDSNLVQNASNFIRSLIEQLVKEIDKYINPDDMSIFCRIETAICMFQDNILNSFAIYKQIRDTITYEQQFLDINEKLEKLKYAVSENKELQNQYSNAMQSFNSVMFNETLEWRKYYHAQITRIAGDLLKSVQVIITEIQNVLNTVTVDQLGRWQRDQAFIANGAQLSINSLDEIQEWFSELAELIYTTRNSIKAIRKLNTMTAIQIKNMNEQLDGFHSQIMQLLRQLIMSGFIVEQQPPQVIKTKTRFAAAVRLLLVGIHLNDPLVTVSILSESQAQNQQSNPATVEEEVSGKIATHNTCRLEMQEDSQHLTCNLTNMQLMSLERGVKKLRASVMDEKYTLLFKTTFKCLDVPINVWVMSLPIVVTVHGNQEAQASATIIWDNAFSEIGRPAFTVVDHVNWSRMASALNSKFFSQTNRGLTNENLSYLCEKALHLSESNSGAEGFVIDWIQFCKKQLPNRTFTFWDWYYAAMKLTRDQLREHWESGHIIGFISREDAVAKLLQCSPGTFLLRFSDSEIGGITIFWKRMVDNQPEIIMLAPFCLKDLEIRNLVNCLNDLKECVTLYPDIPKENAFRHSKPTIALKNGYKRQELTLTLSELSISQNIPGGSQQLAIPSPENVAESSQQFTNPSPETESMDSDLYRVLAELQQGIQM